MKRFKELVFTDRKAADAMRVTEAEYKYTLIKTKLFNAKNSLMYSKEVLRTIKPLTKITEADVALALDDLDKKKQQSLSIKEAIAKKLKN